MEDSKDGAENEEINAVKSLEEAEEMLQEYPNLMGTKDVSEAINISVNTLFNWRREKKNLNYIRRGGNIYYMKKTIVRFLTEGTVICT